MDKKICLQCRSLFLGRSDKRFCTDQCRATYHNNSRSKEERLIGNVNKVLRKNWRILKTLNPKGMSILRKEVLLEMGYNFTYFTSIYNTQEGNQYNFCYDMGILLLDDSKVRIVEHQTYMKK
jgi:hypothetical protein